MSGDLSHEDILKIISENNALKNRVQQQEVRISALKQIASDFGPDNIALNLNERKSSITLEDETEIKICATPEELASLKHLFNSFDADKRGYITSAELKSLHKKLGEPITDKEAEEAFSVMDFKNEGQVTFPQFMKWWQIDHQYDSEDKEDQTARYRSKFKFLKAKVDGINVEQIDFHEEGYRTSLEWRCHFEYLHTDGTVMPISPWHDVPLKNSDGSLNFICEIPKWTRAKNEIATGEAYNPIKQDVRNGLLRSYAWGDMMFNYGAFPQTWEDPSHISHDTGCRGDNDPLDVIEIGLRQREVGSITPVKVLGIFAMIDAGETDWKVLVIFMDDPLSDLINDVPDVKLHMPGAIHAIREWLRMYKTVVGKEQNTFGLDEKCMPREYALNIIEETHAFWKELIMAKGGMAVV